eukprot:scaffold1354_cov144-Amphora_coffeaeformis.AAC.1
MQQSICLRYYFSGTQSKIPAYEMQEAVRCEIMAFVWGLPEKMELLSPISRATKTIFRFVAPRPKRELRPHFIDNVLLEYSCKK